MLLSICELIGQEMKNNKTRLKERDDYPNTTITNRV